MNSFGLPTLSRPVVLCVDRSCRLIMTDHVWTWRVICCDRLCRCAFIVHRSSFIVHRSSWRHQGAADGRVNLIGDVNKVHGGVLVFGAAVSVAVGPVLISCSGPLFCVLVIFLFFFV